MLIVAEWNTLIGRQRLVAGIDPHSVE